MKLKEKVFISNIRRTPFAQISKGLAKYDAHELGMIVAKDILAKSKIDKSKIDGILVGEAFPTQPNVARVIGTLLGLPLDKPALTVSNNCVSSLEAVACAARRIALDEGEVFLTLGQESLTAMPVSIYGSRRNKKTSTVEKLKALLPDQLPEEVTIVDVLEGGLAGDSEVSVAMHVTAELVAQKYQISRELSDKLAYQSFKRAYDATHDGKYDPHIIPIEIEERGKPVTMKGDESVLLRKGIVENPDRMKKAMLLFDNPSMNFSQFQEKYKQYLNGSDGKQATVSIFNACPRSDGGAGVFVSSEAGAKQNNLEVEASLLGFSMRGVSPNFMGIGQAEASLQVLKDCGLTMDDIDAIEIHEAFAATAIGALMEIERRTGYKWEKNFDEGRINPFGSSIAIGHPFGATGIRLLSNAVMNMRHNPDVNRVLLTACAHGGVAGAAILERV